MFKSIEKSLTDCSCTLGKKGYMPKTVVLADDHPFIVQGMEALIQAIPELEVVGTASNGIEAISLIKRLSPDCAVLDLSMPGANGLEVFLEAKRWSPKTKFAIITGISAATLFKRLYDAGIDGLFVKNTSPEAIAAGLIKVANGKRVISKEAMTEIASANKNTELSKREMEILRELALGQNNKVIAEKLGISPKTVGNHRTSLLRKMNVNSTAALLVKAMKSGLIDH